MGVRAIVLITGASLNHHDRLSAIFLDESLVTFGHLKTLKSRIQNTQMLMHHSIMRSAGNGSRTHVTIGLLSLHWYKVYHNRATLPASCGVPPVGGPVRAQTTCRFLPPASGNKTLQRFSSSSLTET